MEVEVSGPPLEAWYMDNSTEDQRLPHHLAPRQYVSPEKLAELGVLHWIFDAENYECDPQLQEIKKDRGYTYQDICEVTPEKLPNYDMKVLSFYEEHIHTDEEIRLILGGSGKVLVSEPPPADAVCGSEAVFSPSV